MARLPTFFLSHGGGPWPYMTGPIRDRFTTLEASLKELVGSLKTRPSAILVISGHWEERDFGVMANPQPPMVYDYSGFPSELYRIRYPAPGHPALAQRTYELITDAGFPAHLDDRRGFDHGTYSVLAVTHPAADVPVIQVSMQSSYEPRLHLNLGQALAPLRDEGVLIVGSGGTYHNFQPKNPRKESSRFDSWLNETLIESNPTERALRLMDWEKAPAARDAHPREDHLVPLFVASGAAMSEPGSVIYREENFFGRITQSSYRFGTK